MLSFKHLVFIEVAQLKSFTKASQALYISQPAVSKNIRQLEDDYKTSLFERKGNSIALTHTGELLLKTLLQAKALQNQLVFEISTHLDQYSPKGELKLGASTTVALYIIPVVLSRFHQKHPQVKISLLNRNSENTLKALMEGEIDLGIIEGKNRLSIVNSQLFLTDEVVPVCSASSGLARKPKLRMEDIAKYPVALRERGSGTLAAIKYALSIHGIKLSDLNVSVRLSGTEALKNFVLADDCIGFLPMRSVMKELADGSLVRLHIDRLSITRQFYFIQRHGDKNDGLSNAFVKFAKTHYNLK